MIAIRRICRHKNVPNCVCGQDSASDPTGELTVLLTPLAGFKGREGRRREWVREVREGQGVMGKERKEGEEGEGERRRKMMGERA